MSHLDEERNPSGSGAGGDGGNLLLPPPPAKEEEEERDTGPGTFDEQYPFDWRTKFRTDAVSAVERWSKDFGISKFALDSFVRDNMQQALNYIQINVAAPAALNASRNRRGEQIAIDVRPWTPSSVSDFEQIWNAGIARFSMILGFDLSQKSGKTGTGSRGPTAQDIRNMFDEDQLTEAANSIWQSRLVEDAPNARSMAKAYINEMVRGRGEKKIDFEQFILNKVEADSRHKLIYSNKPEGVSDLAHIQPYVQAAMNAMGGTGGLGQQMSDVAVGGAALGASAGAFQQRLARTSANQNSQGFINGLEDRVSGVSNLLRG